METPGSFNVFFNSILFRECTHMPFQVQETNHFTIDAEIKALYAGVMVTVYLRQRYEFYVTTGNN